MRDNPGSQALHRLRRAGLVLALLFVAGQGSAQGVNCAQRSAPLIPCGWPKDTTEAQKRETGTAVFIFSTTLVVYSNLVWQWDRDPGGYPDKFYSEKFLAHAGAAAFLTQSAIALHVKPSTAVLWTCVTGVGWELSQGHVNRHDIAADVVGALTGAVLARILRMR